VNDQLQTHVGACSRPTDLQVRPVRRVHEDHQMSLCNECETVQHCLKHGCIPKQPLIEDEKPTPADGQLVWAVVAFIVLMLGLLTLRSCL